MKTAAPPGGVGPHSRKCTYLKCTLQSVPTSVRRWVHSDHVTEMIINLFLMSKVIVTLKLNSSQVCVSVCASVLEI